MANWHFHLGSYQRINNSYGCANSKTLNGLLKTELGFQVSNHLVAPASLSMANRECFRVSSLQTGGLNVGSDHTTLAYHLLTDYEHRLRSRKCTCWS